MYTDTYTEEMSTTLRVSEETRDRFAVLSRSTGQPMTELLSRAAEALERELFYDQMDERFAQLRSDEGAWADVVADRGEEAGALDDASS